MPSTTCEKSGSTDSNPQPTIQPPCPVVLVTSPTDPPVLKSKASSITATSPKKSLDKGDITPSPFYPSSFDHDLEATVFRTSRDHHRTSTNERRSDCDIWPGQEHWKKKAKEAKLARSHTCLAHLGKRTKVVVKVLIGLLIVGVAVGVGFGVSKPLGAPIWGDKEHR